MADAEVMPMEESMPTVLQVLREVQNRPPDQRERSQSRAGSAASNGGTLRREDVRPAAVGSLVVAGVV
jgi:hypothetical protein